MREIFTPTLVRNLVETNLEYSNVMSFFMFNRLIKKYNLKVEKRHYISHRKFVRPRRNFNPVNSIVTLETVNVEQESQTINEVNTETDINADNDEDSLLDSSTDDDDENTLPLLPSDDSDLEQEREPLPSPSPVFASEEMGFVPTDISNDASEPIYPPGTHLFPQESDVSNSILNETFTFPNPAPVETDESNNYWTNLNPNDIHFSIGTTAPRSRNSRRRRNMRRRTRR